MSLSGPVAATVTSLPYRRTMSMMNRTPSGEAGVLSVRSHAVNESVSESVEGFAWRSCTL